MAIFLAWAGGQAGGGGCVSFSILCQLYMPAFKSRYLPYIYMGEGGEILVHLKINENRRARCWLTNYHRVIVNHQQCRLSEKENINGESMKNGMSAWQCQSMRRVGVHLFMSAYMAARSSVFIYLSIYKLNGRKGYIGGYLRR